MRVMAGFMKLFAATSIPGILLGFWKSNALQHVFLRVGLKPKWIIPVLDLKIQLTLAAAVPATADAKSFAQVLQSSQGVLRIPGRWVWSENSIGPWGYVVVQEEGSS